MNTLGRKIFIYSTIIGLCLLNLTILQQKQMNQINNLNVLIDYINNRDASKSPISISASNGFYEAPIWITGSTSVLTDFQVKIQTSISSIINNLTSDGRDLRFFSQITSHPYSDTTGKLSFWIENVTSSQLIAWVKIPSIPTTGTTIYMYYGNSSAPSESNGSATFEFFDGFDGMSLDTSKWNTTGSYNVNNSLELSTGAVYTNKTVISNPQNHVIEMKAKWHTGGAGYSGLCIGDETSFQAGNPGAVAFAYFTPIISPTFQLRFIAADGTAASYNLADGSISIFNTIADTYYIEGFKFHNTSYLEPFVRSQDYSGLAMWNYTGTWTNESYLWIGHYSGSGAGTTNVDDCTVDWVRIRKNVECEPIASIGWENNGSIISLEYYNQEEVQICSDGNGGAIITWTDYRHNNFLGRNIYAQRINATGYVMWRDGGVPICTANNDQYGPQICNDGEDNFIITWHDSRNGNLDIYAQKVNDMGEIQWQENGITVCDYGPNCVWPQLCSVGEGNIIITWIDNRGGSNDIYAQKINSTGGLEWTTDGVAICTVSDNQIFPQLCSDGEGGAIISWEDYRNTANYDIYAQRVNSSGGVEWAPGGVGICVAGNNQQPVQICSDGHKGAIIIWGDFRSGTYSDIYAQRVNNNGERQWLLNGIPICSASGSQGNAQIQKAGSDEAIITWSDYRVTSDGNIYAQKVNFNGDVQWATDGIAICTAIGEQREPQLCVDILEGAVITWKDSRNGNWDIYMQKIDSNGKIQLEFNGIPACTESSEQNTPQICSDGSLGAIITWIDKRSSSYYDIYAQYLEIDDKIPTCNCPSDIITTISGSEMIPWRLYDDYGCEQYRVWVNDTNDNCYIWVNWACWTNNTPIYIPINRTATGKFNYTIEFTTSTCQTATDTVIVTIKSPSQFSNELLATLIATKGGGDIMGILLSPMGLGIMIGIIALFAAMFIILIKNNQTIKELNKKISKLESTKTISKKYKDEKKA